MTLAQEAQALSALRRKRDKAKESYEQLKAQADQAERQLFDRMEAEDVGSIKVGSHSFVRVGTVYGNVQDRSAFIAWAEANAPELLETKERKALVNEIVRERIDNGDVLPDGLGFYVREYVSQRAA